MGRRCYQAPIILLTPRFACATTVRSLTNRYLARAGINDLSWTRSHLRPVSANGAWPRGQPSYGSQRDCGQAKSQNTTVESEFIMNSSNSSNFAKRNSRPVKPTSPLSAEMASAVRSPSSASLIAAK